MEERIGTRLKDRPEFYNKPKPVTFLKNDKVIDAISVMAKNNFGSVVVTDELNCSVTGFTNIVALGAPIINITSSKSNFYYLQWPKWNVRHRYNKRNI